MFGCVRIHSVIAFNITIHAALGIFIHPKEAGSKMRPIWTTAIDSLLCLILVNRVLGAQVNWEHEGFRVWFVSTSLIPGGSSKASKDFSFASLDKGNSGSLCINLLVDVIRSPAISGASVQKSQSYHWTLMFYEVCDHGAVSLNRKDKWVAEISLFHFPFSKHWLYARLDLLEKGFRFSQLSLILNEFIFSIGKRVLASEREHFNSLISCCLISEISCLIFSFSYSALILNSSISASNLERISVSSCFTARSCSSDFFSMFARALLRANFISCVWSLKS